MLIFQSFNDTFAGKQKYFKIKNLGHKLYKSNTLPKISNLNDITDYNFHHLICNP